MSALDCTHLQSQPEDLASIEAININQQFHYGSRQKANWEQSAYHDIV